MQILWHLVRCSSGHIGNEEDGHSGELDGLELLDVLVRPLRVGQEPVVGEERGDRVRGGDGEVLGRRLGHHGDTSRGVTLGSTAA